MKTRVAHHRSRQALQLVAIAVAFFCVSASASEQFDAKVIGIADGDTLTVLHEIAGKMTPRRIRLSGIDAPEKAQAFGSVARDQLARLAFNQVGHLDCRTYDHRYDRSVCVVRVGGLDVGLRLIELGLAWHYKRYAYTQPGDEAASYTTAELSARNAKAGLWRDLGAGVAPQPPWTWRRATAQQ